MIYDVCNPPAKVTEIAWCKNESLNLTKITHKGGIHVKSSRITNVEETKNLIKALEKAIELGWVK